ncbi:glycosyltransferase family protein, partial [Balneolaceae bacterium ANBcel3]|nr:glycosyltransferase family protein [Balneolaceae bacterium ANBcel3]
MKILYGIQGTGNGHVSRARSFIPKLKEVAEIDVLISGSASEMHPGVSVSYQLHGLGFTFGKTGGIDFIDSFKNFRPYTLIKDIRHLPVTAYDLVISDFEPISAWAAKRNQIPCIGLSHQASFLSNRVPRPEKKNIFSEAVLKHYAPCTHPIGFHYREYDHFIYSPIIRKEIRELRNMQAAPNSSKREHITVYLPAYKDISLIKRFLQISSVDWHIFSKKASSSFSINNVYIKPVNKTAYEQSLATCRGVICGAGFEAPSEALYLGKPLMVIPMKWQYEQQCN